MVPLILLTIKLPLALILPEAVILPLIFTGKESDEVPICILLKKDAYDITCIPRELYVVPNILPLELILLEAVMLGTIVNVVSVLISGVTTLVLISLLNQ